MTTRVSAIALFVEPGGGCGRHGGLRCGRPLQGRARCSFPPTGACAENALAVFDRTFAITVALQILATLVAFIGILSTLMSLQLERMREIGVLRATGMTRRQLWRLSLEETGLIGATAGLLAMPTGFVLALILIYIINLRSFGWTLEMRLQPRSLSRPFWWRWARRCWPGIYPAWRMGQVQPAIAVRSE